MTDAHSEVGGARAHPRRMVAMTSLTRAWAAMLLAAAGCATSRAARGPANEVPEPAGTEVHAVPFVADFDSARAVVLEFDGVVRLEPRRLVVEVMTATVTFADHFHPSGGRTLRAALATPVRQGWRIDASSLQIGDPWLTHAEGSIWTPLRFVVPADSAQQRSGATLVLIFETGFGSSRWTRRVLPLLARPTPPDSGGARTYTQRRLGPGAVPDAAPRGERRFEPWVVGGP